MHCTNAWCWLVFNDRRNLPSRDEDGKKERYAIGVTSQFSRCIAAARDAIVFVLVVLTVYMSTVSIFRLVIFNIMHCLSLQPLH